jgi:hypothetical protein
MLIRRAKDFVPEAIEKIEVTRPPQHVMLMKLLPVFDTTQPTKIGVGIKVTVSHEGERHKQCMKESHARNARGPNQNEQHYG